MRFSEFCNKEMIDLDNGERMGVLGQADLVIHPETGDIDSIILTNHSFLAWGKKRDQVIIPWNTIRKVGPEMIIVELKERGRARF